ncbi:hypothetical protein [Streptomyces sp. NPDC003514]
MPVFTRLSRRRPDDDSTGAAASAESEGAEGTVGAPEEDPPASGSRLARLRAWRTRYPTAARVLSLSVTALAALLVIGALLLPNTFPGLRPDRFTRIPAEAILGVAVVVVLPRRPRLVAAVVYGVGLAVVTLLNLLDMGFHEYLGRGFNAALDWSLLPDAKSYVADTLGGAVATGAAVGLVVLALLLIAVLAAATVRLANVR